MGLFNETECQYCGSKNHASKDCRHERGVFFRDTECEFCGSKDHASKDCPHERGTIFRDTECEFCGGKDHASKDCPHERGIFFRDTECEFCGSKDHPSEKCPHERGIFFRDTECEHCGSKKHPSEKCPHERGIFSIKTNFNNTSTKTNSDFNGNTSNVADNPDEGWVKILGWLLGVGILIFVVIWLAFNVVLPIVFLNSALILTLLAISRKHNKILFSILALLGGCYMFLDISNGWFSNNFVNNVVKDTTWITVFIYINAIAMGVSTWFLLDPTWSKANNLVSTNRQKGIILKIGSILLISIATLTIPIWYNFFHQRFILNSTQTISNSPTSTYPTQQSNFSNETPQAGEDSSIQVTTLSDTINNDYLNESTKVQETVNHTEMHHNWITCTSCNGKGEILANISCTKCNGSKKSNCDNCNGKGHKLCDNCSGKGHKVCDNCYGKGYRIDSYNGNRISCTWCAGKGTNQCTWCSAKGNIACGWCVNGKINCNRCYGEGVISKNSTCTKCEGKGQIQADI